jgi:hypothetical protein
LFQVILLEVVCLIIPYVNRFPVGVICILEVLFRCEFVREEELIRLAIKTNGSLAEEGVAMSISSSI